MKITDYLNLAGERRRKLLYSKDLPHYRLLKTARAIFLIGFLSFAVGLFMSGRLRVTLFILAAILILFASLTERIVIFIRESRHDLSGNDKDLFDVLDVKSKKLRHDR